MVKPIDEVISDFNEIVNMTADELDAFLKTEGSTNTGLAKADGSGEAIGHESGRKIVDILKRNPSKDPSKYTEEDKEHMRRVVSYCKRHLAQEGKLKETKGLEDLEKSKSTRSLKNWGHDPMKTIKADSKPASSEANKPASKKAEKPAPKKPEKITTKSGEKPVPETDEKTTSKKPASKPKPASKKTEEKEEVAKPASKVKPASRKAATAKKSEDAGTGEKRAVAEEKVEKPASKKAKTAKPASEGSRKPPSRISKKA